MGKLGAIVLLGTVYLCGSCNDGVPDMVETSILEVRGQTNYEGEELPGVLPICHTMGTARVYTTPPQGGLDTVERYVGWGGAPIVHAFINCGTTIAEVIFGVHGSNEDVFISLSDERMPCLYGEYGPSPLYSTDTSAHIITNGRVVSLSFRVSGCVPVGMEVLVELPDLEPS